MALKIGYPSLSCVGTSLSSPYQRKRNSELRLSDGSYKRKQFEVQLLRNANVKSCQFAHQELNIKGWPSKRQSILCAASEDELSCSEVKSDASEEEKPHPNAADISPLARPDFLSDGTAGKPGLISFYDRPYRKEDKIFLSGARRSQSSLLWLAGPVVIVASFIFPSLYLRRILSSIFEDSLLTDFLILFFTEALFYSGVVIFLLLIDRSRRPMEPVYLSNIDANTPELAYRISSVATLVLSLIIPMVTMGLVWPWTGPAASATLAPYLVGIVVQFAFERYAKYLKSPSWPVIPIVFQVYRLHQLNRAAQLVTALSFTVRGAEMTPHNLAINNSLGTLLNVLQLLGVICIWSLSSFLMKYSPSSIMTEL